MGALIVMSALVVFVVWRLRRRARKNTLAGLVSDRPVFMVSPPTRWSTSSKDHRL